MSRHKRAAVASATASRLAMFAALALALCAGLIWGARAAIVGTLVAVVFARARPPG